MPSLRLHVLGSPRIERPGHAVDLKSAKAVALLGYVALSEVPIARDRLLDLLWPSSAPEAARKNLRNTLWAIRHDLGEDALRVDDDHIELAASVWVDARELERQFPDRDLSLSASQAAAFESAVDLYRGPLLDGLTIEDAPDFEIWLTAARERLERKNLQLLSALVSFYQTQGQWNKVISLAERALAQDNLQEPMYRSLMEAYARLGQRAAALRAYDSLHTALEKELGVYPLGETDALRSAILSGAYDSSTPSLPSKRERITVTAPQDSIPFVGRQAARAVLDAELASALKGQARAALITGELGIGKSRLWHEWSRGLANQEYAVLETRALESTQALPFAPIAELLRQEPVARCLFGSDPCLAPVWRAEIARLLPELNTGSPPTTTPPVSLPPAEERRRLFDALVEAFIVLGDKPLVFFIDDLQWADMTTLDWLDYLIHKLNGEHLLVVLAWRPQDAPAALVSLMTRWTREGLARRVPLERLNDQETTELATALGVDPAARARIYRQSAGNPYFLIELVRALPEEDVPPVLADLVRARLDRLPDTARQISQAAAVLEPDFDFNTLRRTSGRDEAETLDGLDTLLAARVLSELGESYAFSHPLVGEVIRAGLSGARRTFLHRRAAQAMQAIYSNRLAPVAGRIAEHYQRAGDVSLAASYAEMAAAHALSVPAPAEATAFYRQSLALEPTPARARGLGQALLRQGDLVGARSAFENALRGFEAAGDKRNAGRTSLDMAEAYFPSGLFEQGNRWIEKAITYLGNETDPEAHAMAHLLLGTSRADTGETEQAQDELRLAAQHAREQQLYQIGARSLFFLGNLLAEQGDLSSALSAFAESIQLAEQAGDEFQQALGLNNLAYHSVLAGDLETAHRTVDQGIQLAEQRALRLPLQHLYSTRGEIALAEQQWKEAESWFTRGLAEAERNQNEREVANAHANLALAARGQGDLDVALVHLETAFHAAGHLTDRHLQIKIDLALTELYLERGEQAAAKETLTRAQTALKFGPRRLWREWADRLAKQLKSP